jgi:hypothetical protein
MLRRLTYSQLLLWASVAPAFAGGGGGGADADIGALLIQAASRLVAGLRRSAPS